MAENVMDYVEGYAFEEAQCRSDARMLADFAASVPCDDVVAVDAVISPSRKRSGEPTPVVSAKKTTSAGGGGGAAGPGGGGPKDKISLAQTVSRLSDVLEKPKLTKYVFDFGRFLS